MNDKPIAPREKRRGVVPRKQDVYNKIAVRSNEIIEYLFSTMNNTKAQDAVRISAANKLLDKIVPNLKASDVNLSGDSLFKVIIQDYGANNKPPEIDKDG